MSGYECVSNATLCDLGYGWCRVQCILRLAMDVYRVPYLVNLALNGCLLPYIVRLAMVVSCAI